MNAQNGAHGEASAGKDVQAASRDEGLRILARLIARSYLRKNLDFGRDGHESDAGASQQESLSPTAKKRGWRTISRLEGER